MTEKHILVVNDDGINSPGIRAAVRALKGIASVVVCAPSVQQSGVGRSISLFTPVALTPMEIEGVEGYAISGTPVDAVVVGMYGIMDKKPDLVVSGINMGENLSFEATTSGTVGAALEAANQDVPAIALSIHASERVKFEHLQPELDFGTAEHVMMELALEVLEGGLPEDVDVLNVNVPHSVENAKVVVTRLAKRMYTTKVHRRRDPRGRLYFWIDGDEVVDSPKGTDVQAVRVENRISLTPLSIDLTSHPNLKQVEGMAEQLSRRLGLWQGLHKG